MHRFKIRINLMLINSATELKCCNFISHVKTVSIGSFSAMN